MFESSMKVYVRERCRFHKDVWGKFLLTHLIDLRRLGECVH